MKITPGFGIPKTAGKIGGSRAEDKDNSGVGFNELLKKSVQEVNELQLKAEDLDKQFAMGTLENVHDVIIAAEKAALALELTVQVRNKVLEAYQEIMRTPL